MWYVEYQWLVGWNCGGDGCFNLLGDVVCEQQLVVVVVYQQYV